MSFQELVEAEINMYLGDWSEAYRLDFDDTDDSASLRCQWGDGAVVALTIIPDPEYSARLAIEFAHGDLTETLTEASLWKHLFFELEIRASAPRSSVPKRTDSLT